MIMLARGIVATASTLIGEGDARIRYREQWLADVDGAEELGRRPVSVAFGSAAAAVRVAGHHRWTRRELVSALRFPEVGARPRQAVGLLLLTAVAPYAWGLAFVLEAAAHLGMTPAELISNQGDLDFTWWWPPLVLSWLPYVLWSELGGWVVAAVLTPAGFLLSVGGRRSARWLPLAGALAGLAVTVLVHTDFWVAMQRWILD
jgi:hypothetical protein